MKTLLALATLAAVFSMCGLSGRLWNKGDANNTGGTSNNTGSASSGTGSASNGAALSDDDKHKLFQAAAQCGDTQLRLEALKRMCLSPGENVSREDFQKFVQDHAAWATQNVVFVVSLSSQDKARDYVNQHMPPAGENCPAPAKGAAAAQQDACALASISDVAGATGMPVAYMNGVSYTGDQSECDYRPTKGSLRGVLVIVNWKGGQSELKKALAGESGAAKVEGVGDEAYAAGQSFYARKGDTLVTIQIVGSPGNSTAKAKALALKMIDKL